MHQVEVSDDDRIVDSNGTLYLLRWNRGWFDIVTVEEDHEEEGVYWTDSSPVVSFPKGKAEAVIEHIEEEL